MEYTTHKGTRFTLAFDGLYRWKAHQGSLHSSLDQGFVYRNDAKNAMKHYDKVILDKGYKDESTTLEKLDILTKKDELVSFAKTQGIDVPPGLTKPTQIKKMIKAELEQVDA